MKQKTKPIKLKLARQSIDWLLEIIGGIGIVFIILIPVIYYPSLPDVIPSHFGIDGNVDATSDKSFIWILPMIGLFTYIGLAVLNRYPEVFNYPKKITEENAEQQYRLATRLIRFLNSIIISFFAYMSFSIVHTALGNQDGMVNTLSIAFIIAIFASIAIYLFFSSRKSSN